MPKPDDVGVGTALIILNEKGEILLGERKGAHRAGHWCCPGGWLDRPDPTTDVAVIREAYEETGLLVERVHHHMWTSEDHPHAGFRSITLYHFAFPDDWKGTPRVMEPEKCTGWAWFAPNDLPSPLFPGIEKAVKALGAVIPLARN